MSKSLVILLQISQIEFLSSFKWNYILKLILFQKEIYFKNKNTFFHIIDFEIFLIRSKCKYLKTVVRSVLPLNMLLLF